MSTINLTPIADGAYDQLTPSGCANSFECIDDPPGSPDDDTTYLSLSSGTGRQSVIVNAFYAGETINNVTVLARCKNGGFASALTVYPFVRINGTDYDDPAGATAYSTYDDFSYTWNTNPDTAAAWTPADLAALEAGLRLVATGSPGRLTQIYVIVDYTPGNRAKKRKLRQGLAPGMRQGS
jgi:hypothetical protein